MLRKTIQKLALLVLVFFYSWVPISVAAAAKRPNVIFILADDLGYGELGCYGQRRIETPNIDRLASEGIRFTNHYAGNAVCAPSRCCLMTGRHPGHATIRDNRDPKHLVHLRQKYGWEFPGQYPIAPSDLTLAELLKKNGYATAAIGKWGLGHFGTSGDPNVRGFDLFYGFNSQRHAHNHFPRFLWRNGSKESLAGNDRSLNGETYSQDNFIEASLDFIRQNQRRPFFLYLPLAVPHVSIQVPARSVDAYREKIPEEDYEHESYLQHPYPRAGYAAMITHMDDGVGKIMALIEELGLDKDTLILFSSDNGPAWPRFGGTDSIFFNSTAGLRGYKGSLYEGGIRVPLVARWPGRIKRGRQSDHICAFWDLLPTIAEITGASAPPDIDGISYAPTLLGRPEKQATHDQLYWEFAGYGGQQAVRKGDWKAMRKNILLRGNKEPLRIWLFNLKTDRAELHDVARQNPELVDTFRKIMHDSRSASKLFPIPPLDTAQLP